MNGVSPRISTSELEVKKTEEMGGEGKGRDEVCPRISTSTKKKMEMELANVMRDEQYFDLYLYTRVLELDWSRLFSTPSTTDATSLSPMYFTHSTTGCTRYATFVGSTLQMYSIEVTEIKDALGLRWPLHVYGMVAARDTVDGNRNIIFLRRRNNCQTLTQEDSRLHLTGPSRAIVATDHVDFDIELKIRGKTKSEDIVLMSRTFKYSSSYSCLPTTLFGEFCQIALQFEKLDNTVQATIVGVRVTEPRRVWPFKYGGLVTCVAKGSSKPGQIQGRVSKPDVPEDKTELSKEVVLQDQVMANRSDGYVDLSRHVVSVELGGKLEVIINECSESGTFSNHKVHVFFEAQECKISRETCYLGHSKVEVTVAWSSLLQDKWSTSREGRFDGNQGPRISTSELEIGEAKEFGGETNGRDEVSPRISSSELEIEEAKEMEGEGKVTVGAEIYSFLDLISKKVMNLKADSKLRISSYSRSEIQIHMDDMRSEVTNLLLMMEIPREEPATRKMRAKGVQIRTDGKGESASETQAPRNFDFQLKSILKRLKEIHMLLVEEEKPSYKDTLESKSISELPKETQDSLTKIKVEAGIKEKETNEAPQKFSLDAVSGANGMDEVSRRISTSGLQIEEANEMGGETNGRDVVRLCILNYGLKIEEDKETGKEAKGRDEVSPSISTSTKTKLEMEEAKMRKVLTEEEIFDRYRRGWVSNWSSVYGSFTDTTTLSPMHFTHCTPGQTQFAAFISSTLQMYSIKVADINELLVLKWPLRVYGVVAARDTVDRNRNILFSRRRDDYQELHKQDPFLRLTGPSRAIVTEEPIHVEIELKARGTTESEDRVLMSRSWRYSDRLCTLYTPLAGKYCTLVLSSEELKASVQATIVSVQITRRKPGLFKHGGRVVCSSPPQKGILPDSKHITAPLFRQVVLQDGELDVCSNGFIALSRQVVSVELCGRLEILIYEYSQSRGIAEHGRVSIKPQKCNITQHKCHLGDSELQIRVAWSRLVRDKGFISMEGSDDL